MTVAPDTLVGVQASSDERLGLLLDAGAAAVFSRRTPPRAVGAELGLLVASSRRSPLSPGRPRPAARA